MSITYTGYTDLHADGQVQRIHQARYVHRGEPTFAQLFRSAVRAELARRSDVEFQSRQHFTVQLPPAAGDFQVIGGLDTDHAELGLLRDGSVTARMSIPYPHPDGLSRMNAAAFDMAAAEMAAGIAAAADELAPVACA
jgi:hypothetical protein